MPARATSPAVQDLLGTAENVISVADPASLMSDLLGAPWMTLINAAGFIAANMRRSGVMQGRFELSVNARLA